MERAPVITRLVSIKGDQRTLIRETVTEYFAQKPALEVPIGVRGCPHLGLTAVGHRHTSGRSDIYGMSARYNGE